MDASSSGRLIFAQFPEALFQRSYADRLTPRLKDRLRAEGLDLDHRLLPAYPVERQAAWLKVLAEEAHGDLPRAEAMREIGYRFLSGWQQTLVGKAAAAMLRVVGPRRALLRVERAFRTGDNFTVVKAEELSPTRIRLHINEVHGAPEYFAGLMVAGGHLTGAANPRASVERVDGAGAVILVEWDGPAR